ncbi:hypothetical protein A3A39_00625 [Candidatus Kaiserbacteria bacterium RIFCSPLOWO2_01_FULL_54_13]|uniref:Uncharacterized protein n=1 Tax=Candidatus Kaiserbacteria bacterium RIFCSPLOWO2_01_FULL_54_13 TaxID=1798512 RepID=A0A1F6EZT7_9BACT|nr:MAG: hypothetical protein A3A39_00625 [Candidatus Kaiserbacteria bacterium RIFCSPLOWO2_01_FULL_54_13]
MAVKESNITPALRAAIAESVQEVLNDPDFGLELRPEAKKRLLASLKKKKQRWTSLGEIRRKYS